MRPKESSLLWVLLTSLSLFSLEFHLNYQLVFMHCWGCHQLDLLWSILGMDCEPCCVPYSGNTVQNKNLRPKEWKEDYTFCMVDGKLSIAATLLRTLHSLRQQLKILFKKAWAFHIDVRDVCFLRKKIPVCWINFSLMLRVGDLHKVSSSRNTMLEKHTAVWSLKPVHATV